MSKQEPLGVFVHDGLILTSPNRSFLPPDGIPRGDPETISTRLANIWRRGWVCDDVLEAGFYPIKPTFATTILAPLTDMPRHMTALEEDGKGGYRVRSWEQFHTLEQLFSKMIPKLREFLDASPYANLSNRVANVKGPSQYPYQHLLSKSDARTAAFKARGALVHQVAKLVFFVALCNEVKSDNSGWYQILSHAGVDRADLDSVKASYIVDSRWNLPHAGFFIKPDWPLCKYLQFFVIWVQGGDGWQITMEGEVGRKDDVRRRDEL